MGPGIATGSRATSRRTGSEEVAMFPLPGGIGVSHLRAYDWEAEDGAMPRDDNAARRRRDLAVRGYLPLREAARNGDLGPLQKFHRAAAALVAPKLGDWVPRWRDGALAAAKLTGEHLEALANGDA